MARRSCCGHLKTALAAQWAGLVNKSVDVCSLYHIASSASSDSSTAPLSSMQYSARETPTRADRRTHLITASQPGAVIIVSRESASLLGRGGKVRVTGYVVDDGCRTQVAVVW